MIFNFHIAIDNQNTESLLGCDQLILWRVGGWILINIGNNASFPSIPDYNTLHR